MKKQEKVYSDWLSVATGGQREVRFDKSADRIDVLIPGRGTTLPTIIEVKYARGMREAIGQVQSYAMRIGYPVNRRIHLILSANNVLRTREDQRINIHRDECTNAGIVITTQVERTNLPTFYDIGGLRFDSREAIDQYIRQLRHNVNIAGFVCAEYRQFMNAVECQHVSQLNNSLRRWIVSTHYQWLQRPEMLIAS